MKIKCHFLAILAIEIVAIIYITSYMVLYVTSMYAKTVNDYSSQFMRNGTVTANFVWKGMYLRYLPPQTRQWDL